MPTGADHRIVEHPEGLVGDLGLGHVDAMEGLELRRVDRIADVEHILDVALLVLGNREPARLAGRGHEAFGDDVGVRAARRFFDHVGKNPVRLRGVILEASTWLPGGVPACVPIEPLLTIDRLSTDRGGREATCVEQDLREGDGVLAVFAERRQHRRHGGVDVEQPLGCEFEHGEADGRLHRRVGVEAVVVGCVAVGLCVDDLVVEADGELVPGQAALVDFTTAASDEGVEAGFDDRGHGVTVDAEASVLRTPFSLRAGRTAVNERSCTTPCHTPTP